MIVFFNDTATTEIYTLSLHDALPISGGDVCHLPVNITIASEGVECHARSTSRGGHRRHVRPRGRATKGAHRRGLLGDRKSTRLNSSHTVISYAVFCLKKKKKNDR